MQHTFNLLSVIIQFFSQMLAIVCMHVDWKEVHIHSAVGSASRCN